MKLVALATIATILIANLAVCMEYDDLRPLLRSSQAAPLKSYEGNTLLIYNTTGGQVHAYYNEKHHPIAGIEPLESTLEDNECERIIEIVLTTKNRFGIWRRIKQTRSATECDSQNITTSELINNSRSIFK